MLIQRKNCPICNSENLKLLKDKIDNQTIVKFLENYYQKKLPDEISNHYKYKILKCNKCSLKFQKFVCDEKLSFLLYEEIIDKDDSYNKKKNLSYKDFQEYIYDMNLISSLYKKKSKDIKILEFGSGWGFWSRLAKSLNYDIEGIEISESRINFSKDFKINIFKQIDQSKKYDFIYSNQVFEHLTFPNVEFSKLVSVLKKNSYLLIKVPSSFLHEEKEIIKKYAFKNVLFPLEHINLYNKKVFRFLAKKYDLEICNYNVLKTKSLYGLNLFLKNLVSNSYVLFKKKY